MRPTAPPVLPGEEPEPEPEVPSEPGGGQIDVDGEEIVPPGPEPGVDPDPSGSGRVIEGVGPGEKAPLQGAGVVSFGSGGAGLDPTGTRAAAVAGAMLGILAALTSLMWALYQFKPGLIPLPGLGGGSGGGNTMTISAPQEATMHLLSAENTAPVASGFAGNAGGGQTAVTVIRGSGAAAGNGGGTSANFAQHFSAINSSSSAAGGRGYGGGPPEPPIDEDVLIATAPTLRSSPPRGGSPEPLLAESAASANALYATPGAGTGAGFGSGTMHRGIQTEFVDGGLSVGTASRGVSVGAAGGSSTSYVESTIVRNVYTSQQQASTGSGFGGYDASASSAGAGVYSSGLDTSSRYGQQLSGDAMVTSSSSFAYEQRNALGSGGTLQANGYLPSPTGSAVDTSMFGASSGMFQMRNMALSSTAATTATNLMTTAEQIRVDCVQLTNNGRYVVTGSIYGPPQVWDLKVPAIPIIRVLLDYVVTVEPAIHANTGLKRPTLNVFALRKCLNASQSIALILFTLIRVHS